MKKQMVLSMFVIAAVSLGIASVALAACPCQQKAAVDTPAMDAGCPCKDKADCPCAKGDCPMKAKGECPMKDPATTLPIPMPGKGCGCKEGDANCGGLHSKECNMKMTEVPVPPTPNTSTPTANPL